MGMKPRKEAALVGTMTGAIHHQTRRSGHTLNRFTDVRTLISPMEAVGVGNGCCGYKGKSYSITLNLERVAGSITGTLQIGRYKFTASQFRTTWGTSQIFITFANDVRGTPGMIIKSGSQLVIDA